ncbi:hypothetical protein [Streptomyces asoensis]|uniref:Helix-turn-helix domain-containing protein n=1 Tax=Streptomyces asoensis TaxID=249586 RepID=A0ABQ3RYZ9_9ACTN|nr:hypothetical protein [Streptomyces asoensis]GGQ48620.1 hypothetical protein GCM10010496_08590 [Streptomyces asoensis]GHI61051.1 hypothetical protein Saso_27010 [Streptomyces asoensis]
MSSTDEQGPAAGSVPMAIGNALSWKWTRQMSPYLRRSGLPLLLCQLRNFANASGEIAFSGDRKPIRITDIAAAACCREKDARRYLEAATRAGVVRVLGERKRGKTTRYALVPHPFPDWQAAEDYLKSTGRTPGKGSAPWQDDEGSSGHRGPNQIGPPRPDVTDGTAEEVRATAARMSSGHRGPTGSGHRGPNNPGGYPGFPQERAEVGFQPQVVGGSEEQIDSHEHHHDDEQAPPPPSDPDDYETWPRCLVCRHRILPDPRRPDRTVHARCETTTTARERHSA